MEEEVKGQYLIVEYVDDLEEAIRVGKENNISKGVIAGIQTIHDELVEMEGLFKTEAHYKRLKRDCEELINDLTKGCEEGDEALSLASMRQLRDKVGVLKKGLSK